MLKLLPAVVIMVAASTLGGGFAACAEPATTGERQPVEATTEVSAKPTTDPAALPHEATAEVLALGRHLARECSSCHRFDGVENGVPAIIGWPAERMAAALEAYKSDGRRNTVMGSVAKTLAPEQIAALGAYYASLRKR